MPSDADRDKKNEDLDRAKRGIRARKFANAALIANHRAEFDELYAKHRVALGLPPRPGGKPKADLKERIRKQEERLARWRAELRLAEGEE